MAMPIGEGSRISSRQAFACNQVAADAAIFFLFRGLQGEVSVKAE